MADRFRCIYDPGSVTCEEVQGIQKDDRPIIVLPVNFSVKC